MRDFFQHFIFAIMLIVFLSSNKSYAIKDTTSVYIGTFNNNDIYQVGKIAAFAASCDFDTLHTKLKFMFRNHNRFVQGMDDNDLSAYDFVSNLDCAKVRASAQEILSRSVMVNIDGLEQDNHYTYGRIAAYTGFCDLYFYQVSIIRKFGNGEYFDEGFAENDLSRFSYVGGMDCAKVKKASIQLLKRGGFNGVAAGQDEALDLHRETIAKNVAASLREAKRLFSDGLINSRDYAVLKEKLLKLHK